MTKQLCDHPKNYGKECSEENCPDKNEHGITAYEVNVFYASWNCDYGRIDCGDCGKNVGERKGVWITSNKFVCNECAKKRGHKRITDEELTWEEYKRKHYGKRY